MIQLWRLSVGDEFTYNNSTYKVITQTFGMTEVLSREKKRLEAFPNQMNVDPVKAKEISKVA